VSYCRFSSDDSNVYVFGSCEFLEIYVQASERLRDIPKDTPLDEWFKHYRPFPHKLAGKSYMCKTEQECFDKLLELRKSGILVPERALDRLRKEIADHKDSS